MNSNLLDEINRLRKEKNAIILAHYYQNAEIQDLADYVGDSYQLSKVARDTTASMIIFCGVHFMAETAKILSPHKQVYLPVKDAGCYMADTITEAELNEYKQNHPGYKFIAYVNTSANIKALSDVCVTSSNALKVINAYEKEKVLYLPDQNLAKYANYLKKSNPIDYWHGYCDIHHALTVDDVKKMKEKHPEALVLVHPEAPLDVVLLADFAGSTKDILNYVSTNNHSEYIIGTEVGIMHALEKHNPNKKFYLLSDNLVCKTMKYTSLQDIYDVLTLNPNGRYEEIVLDKDTIDKAQNALNEMLKY